MDERFEQALELFKQGKYYECHDVLEALWQETESGDEYRQLYQGVLQCAVTMHLLGQKRYPGARKTFDRALQNLNAYLPIVNS